jgi:hypothetical protein
MGCLFRAHRPGDCTDGLHGDACMHIDHRPTPCSQGLRQVGAPVGAPLAMSLMGRMAGARPASASSEPACSSSGGAVSAVGAAAAAIRGLSGAAASCSSPCALPAWPPGLGGARGGQAWRQPHGAWATAAHAWAPHPTQPMQPQPHAAAARAYAKAVRSATPPARKRRSYSRLFSCRNDRFRSAFEQIWPTLRLTEPEAQVCGRVASYAIRHTPYDIRSSRGDFPRMSPV